jgi:hypothetical protein
MAHAHASPSSRPRTFLRMALTYEGDDCLLWPFSVDTRGYPHVYAGNRKMRTVNRILCEARHGPPPGQREAAHECGNRRCVNKMHLTWKTKKENAADRVRHGTTCRGERCALAKLTEKQVLDIRSLAKSVQLKDIAKHYGVDPSTIGQIVKRRRWAHL